MSFYQQSTISLYSWFLLVLSCNIFLMTFHGSIFLNIKLGPATTSSPRRRGRGLHNLDSLHDQIRFFWLAEVRNFPNIMIEYIAIGEFRAVSHVPIGEGGAVSHVPIGEFGAVSHVAIGEGGAVSHVPIGSVVQWVTPP